jgi:eukaryotic-like serine/threonine-protein kinase
LTGEIPIRGRNRRELLELHQRALPTSMRERRPDLNIPAELDAVVLSCLAKRLDDRPSGARAVERQLAAISPERLILEYPAGTPRRAPPAGQRRSAN